ncbi:ComEA family DNA-binding protein [Planctomicrobium sp. SH664]|uniref:ComEA family DNA-binding protein n=1 Tax=Planctomicrobium sp. SH664 TaxID=3448125 RepID=UPI003F5B403B
MLLCIGLRAGQLYREEGQLIEVHRPHERKFEFQIDINRATWVEWMQLDGIGESLGRRIVAYREEHGPFASIDDIDRVPGIGPAKMQAIRPHLRCVPLPVQPTLQGKNAGAN